VVARGDERRVRVRARRNRFAIRQSTHNVSVIDLDWPRSTKKLEEAACSE
jgi:hypothetical protein